MKKVNFNCWVTFFKMEKVVFGDNLFICLKMLCKQVQFLK